MIWQAVGLLLAAAVACAMLTRAWIAFARRRRIEDEPGRRRLHATATPRGGGVAIAAVVVAALACLGLGGEAGISWFWLAGGIGLFAALGLLDDLVAMPAAAKLLLQLLAAGVLVLPLLPGWSPGWLVSVALVLACAYLVNIWNFMDGSNGMVALQGLLIALALAVWPGQPDDLRLACLAVAGACAGFLPFNFPRALVFLGDVGSHALGASVFMLLFLSWRAGSLGLPQALLISSAFLLDSGHTLLRRALAGRPVWRAHREHLYQYAVRVGHSHARVALCYGAWTVAALGLAGLLGQSRSTFVISSLFILGLVFGTAVHFGLRRRWLGSRTHRGREG